MADVETDDLATRAWARADGVRRRRRIAVTGTAVAAVLAVAGVAALVDQRRLHRAVPERGPDHDDVAARADRCRRGSARRPRRRVPRRPVLVGAARRARRRAPGPPGARPPRRAVDGRRLRTPTSHRTTWTRCSALGKQQYLLLSDERFTSVDLADRLGAVADEGGNEFSPLGPGSVSPDGTQVFFRQPGRVEVWDLPRNSWRTVESADVESTVWTRDGTIGTHAAAGRPDPWDRGDHEWSFPVAGPDGTAAELDWMAEGAERAVGERARLVRQPRVPGRRHPGGARPAGVRDGPEQDVLRADGVVQPRLPAVLRLRRPTAPTGCWPGGSARRTSTASASTPTSRRRNFSASWAEDAFR